MHARGNADFDIVHPAHAAFATTRLAGSLYASRAATARARQIEAHFAAGLCHVAASAASRARLWLANRSRPMAVRAGIQARNRKLLYRAVDGFPESNFDLIFKAGPRLGVRRRLSWRATASKILAEQIAEAGARSASTAAEIESAKIEMHAAGIARNRCSAHAGKLQTHTDRTSAFS